MKLNEILKGLGPLQIKSDQCVYSKINNGNILILAVYVDDILIFWNNEKQKQHLMENLEYKFELTRFGASKIISRNQNKQNK